MRTIAFDTETCLFAPGCMAPPLVCMTWSDGGPAELASHSPAVHLMRVWLQNPEVCLVGHNVSYDMAVFGANYPDLLPLIFRAYEEDRITDTMLRQQLLDIATSSFRGYTHSDGRFQPYQYDLASLAKRCAGIVLTKDATRTSYGELRDLPIDQWPQRAIEYAKDDATATLAVFRSQEPAAEEGWLKDQYNQARAYFALHLMECWGVRTRQESVDHLRQMTMASIDEIKARLVDAGLVRPAGTRNTKEAQARMIEAMQGRVMRVTPTGKPCLDSLSCEESEDPLLEDYARYTELNKVISADLKQMEQGVHMPIHCHYGLAGSGRTTCSKPNLQNLRRFPGVREAYAPRSGWVFIDCDYGQLELWCLAQTCLNLFGQSELARVLNSGEDPHTSLAADILGISYEEAERRKKDKTDHEFAEARGTNGAKGANFGFPGGLGPEKFVKFTAASGVKGVTIDRARDLREAWFRRWPEMRRYFEHINELTSNPAGLATVVMPISGRIRSGAPFCAAANTYFQGMGADIAKLAAWLIAKACYTETESPLFGSRPVVFVHDQFIIETPDVPGAHDAAMETRRLMRKAAQVFAPDCVPDAEPILSKYWSKDAAAVYDKEGRLLPWPQ